MTEQQHDDHVLRRTYWLQGLHGLASQPNMRIANAIFNLDLAAYRETYSRPYYSDIKDFAR